MGLATLRPVSGRGEAGSDSVIRAVPADKGCHSAATLAAIREHTPYCTYIPDPERKRDCRWAARRRHFQPPSTGKSPHMIHTHVKAIFKQAGVHSRAELIVKLMKRE